MIEINGLMAAIALALIIIGPASGVWSGLLIKNLTQRIQEDREDTRSWLKGLQSTVEGNTSDISGIKAVMEDRKDRE